MSIPPPNDPSRGCSSEFSQPLRDEDFVRARYLLDNVNRVNVVEGNLTGVEYRTGDLEFDIRRPVYRWDRRPYQEIFANGFEAWPQGQTPNSTYYNLLHFIEHAGALLDSNRPPTTTHAFVSTTLNNAWHQTLPPKSSHQALRFNFIVMKFMLLVVSGFLSPLGINTNTFLKLKFALLEASHLSTFDLVSYSQQHVKPDQGWITSHAMLFL